MNVDAASADDVSEYVRIAAEAQSFLRSLGLSQWVPAAHAAFLPSLRDKVVRGEVFKCLVSQEVTAFFCATTVASEWWQSYEGVAIYVSGIVVSRQHSGRQIGKRILQWCEAKARASAIDLIRLDCHAESHRLCAYYESLGYAEVARVEQHPGYIGVLREKRVCNPHGTPN